MNNNQNLNLKPAFKLPQPPRIVIADGAGTLFDPGSIVPCRAMESAFLKHGIKVSEPVIMAYMGTKKKDHIQYVLTEIEVSVQFIRLFNRPPQRADVSRIYDTFKEELYLKAGETQEIPGVREAALKLKEAGIKLAMTTGYNRKMTSLVRANITWLDEVISTFVTNSQVKASRPFPYMIFRALEAEWVNSPQFAVKVGDTKVDLQAADALGMPSALVLSGSASAEDGITFDQELGIKHPQYASFVEFVDAVLEGAFNETGPVPAA